MYNSPWATMTTRMMPKNSVRPIPISAYAADTSDQRGETTAGPCGGGSEGMTCSTSNTTSSVFVQTRNSAGVPTDHAFYVAVLG